MGTRIEDKGAARSVARTAVDLLVEQVASMEDHEREAFWDQVRDELLERGCLMPTVEAAPPRQRMTDAQGHAFGCQSMPFGKHRGVTVRDVPLGYLRWLVDDPDHFREKLPAYVEWRESEEESDEEEVVRVHWFRSQG